MAKAKEDRPRIRTASSSQLVRLLRAQVIRQDVRNIVAAMAMRPATPGNVGLPLSHWSSLKDFVRGHSDLSRPYVFAALGHGDGDNFGGCVPVGLR